MSIQTLTKENFTKEVEEAGAPVLVDFWAPWCGYCRRLAPALDAVASEWEGRLSIGKVDVDEQRELALQYRVMSVPTVIFLKNGKEIDRKIGIREVPEYTDILDANL